MNVEYARVFIEETLTLHGTSANAVHYFPPGPEESAIEVLVAEYKKTGNIRLHLAINWRPDSDPAAWTQDDWHNIFANRQIAAYVGLSLLYHCIAFSEGLRDDASSD